MKKFTFSNDPMVRAKEKRLIRKKIIIAIVTMLAALLTGIGLLLMVIGSEMGIFPMFLSGAIIGGIAVVALVFMVTVYYNIPI